MYFITASFILLFILPSIVNGQDNQLVRLAAIEVDSTQLDSYYTFLREEIEASIQKEPGVITLYGIAEKNNPERVVLFETYADSIQYKAHLATPHFQKYKTGTLDMVKHLELIPTQPILYSRKPELPTASTQDLFIRLIHIQLDPSTVTDYHKLVKNVMKPGIKKEPGVLVMYAVAKKNNPTHIYVLEVYANTTAYEKHLKTAHFLKYKRTSKNMVRLLQLIDAKPILLGSKHAK